MLAAASRLTMRIHRPSLGLVATVGQSLLYSSSLISTASAALVQVGIFCDLDNIGPATHSRDDARAFASPLAKFGKSVGTLQTFQAFGNIPTQTYVTQEEKERRQEEIQPYMDGSWNDDDDFGMVQTGYDPDGNLRCGVCGAKMKLTKKDRAKGLSLEGKLDKHMRMLHDREQEKRKTRLKTSKKKKKLTDKEMKKYARYEQAQVGQFRTPATRNKKAKPNNKQKRNDLFRVLKEQKIKCYSTHDTDATLEKAAKKWMKTVRKRAKKNNMENEDILGCLVVVSEDSDFASLLQEASSKGFVAVSATPASSQQTKKLVAASDLILTQNDNDDEEMLKQTINTFMGAELLMDLDADFDDAEE